MGIRSGPSSERWCSAGLELLQLQLQARGAAVSPFLMSMIPYLLTLLVLVFWGLNRRSAAPVALGRNYFGVE